MLIYLVFWFVVYKRHQFMIFLVVRVYDYPHSDHIDVVKNAIKFYKFLSNVNSKKLLNSYFFIHLQLRWMNSTFRVLRCLVLFSCNIGQRGDHAHNNVQSTNVSTHSWSQNDISLLSLYTVEKHYVPCLRDWFPWLYDQFYCMNTNHHALIYYVGIMSCMWTWGEMSTRYEGNNNLKGVLLTVSKPPVDWNILAN